MTLRELRTSRDLTLRYVAEETGIFIGTLSQVERGMVMPTPSQIVELSQFYGVDLEQWRFVPQHEGTSSSPQAAA